MRLRRFPVRVLLPIALMALLGVLATLQYRWLGQVSRAERERMRTTLAARAAELAEDFDRELTRLYLVFQPGAAQPDPFASLPMRFDLWRSSAKYPRMLSGVYVARTIAPPATLHRLNQETRVLEPAQWTEPLTRARDRLSAPALSTGGPMVVRLTPLVLGDPLMLAVPLGGPRLPGAPGTPDRPSAAGYVFLTIDEQYVRGELLPELVRMHLRDDSASYRVAIEDATKPGTPVYATDRARLSREDADVVSPMLAIRFGLADRILGPELRASVAAAGALALDTHADRGGTAERVTVFVEQRRTDTRLPESGTIRFTSFATPGWHLLLKHKSGSLEAAVSRIRTRNLVMSFGMLALLAISTGLVFVSARRAERLAAQQMDFVATVSHELRTPLAVIRSAGQNLADGVVDDPARARRYGELIEGEGRRLTDMIEQTLALAGLSGDRRPLTRQPLDPGAIVREVLASPDTRACAASVDVEVRTQDDLPPVLADSMLVRRAVQNLLLNAAKYAAGGGWVGIAVEADRGGRSPEVRITVSDRGAGIDPRDLPHVFEPFYRGRDATARQVQGNGLGLHLVKRIAEAHGGRVTVKTSVGQGSAFTLHLPAMDGTVPDAVAGAAPQHT